jgi:hypothetical protein
MRGIVEYRNRVYCLLGLVFIGVVISGQTEVKTERCYRFHRSLQP